MVKNSLIKYSKYVAMAGSAIGAVLATPLAHASCLSMTCGLVVPAGTITNFTGAINTYLWTPLTATVFQSQAIQILTTFALVAIVSGIVFMLLRGFRLHH